LRAFFLVIKASSLCSIWHFGLTSFAYGLQCIGNYFREPGNRFFLISELTAVFLAGKLQFSPGIYAPAQTGTEQMLLVVTQAFGFLNVKHQSDLGGSLIHMLTAGTGTAAGKKTNFIVRYGQCGSDTYIAFGWMFCFMRKMACAVFF